MNKKNFIWLVGISIMVLLISYGDGNARQVDLSEKNYALIIGLWLGFLLNEEKV